MRGKFGQANYAAAKAGLIGLTMTAAWEFGKTGDPRSAIASGMVMIDTAHRIADVLNSGSRRGRSGAARAQVTVRPFLRRYR